MVNQVEITINILRTLWTNPILLTYAQLLGAFDFNANPMAPPVKKLIVQVKSNQRSIWSKHGVARWYIGPALEHYRCYGIFVTDTRSERISYIMIFHRV